MLSIENLTTNHLQAICRLVNEEYHSHAWQQAPVQKLSIRLQHEATVSVKYLEIYTNGQVDLFTYHPSMIVQVRYHPINAMLITDYIRSINGGNCTLFNNIERGHVNIICAITDNNYHSHEVFGISSQVLRIITDKYKGGLTREIMIHPNG